MNIMIAKNIIRFVTYPPREDLQQPGSPLGPAQRPPTGCLSPGNGGAAQVLELVEVLEPAAAPTWWVGDCAGVAHAHAKNCSVSRRRDPLPSSSSHRWPPSLTSREHGGVMSSGFSTYPTTFSVV